MTQEQIVNAAAAVAAFWATVWASFWLGSLMQPLDPLPWYEAMRL